MSNQSDRNRTRAEEVARLRDVLGPRPLPGGKPRPSWKRTLQDILWTHNDRHATKPKVVSAKTQAERACALFRCFRDLHVLGYKIRNPHCLGGRHVRALVADWTSDEPRTRRLSPSTLQNELSALRTFAEWIGKPGLVLPAETYVSDPARVARRTAATTDRSWAARGIDPDALIEEIAAYDAWVGAELRIARAFGLRVKEAVMLQPRLAEKVSGQAAAGSDVPILELETERGTKGGRLRHIPIDTPVKRAALEAAKALVSTESQYLADPARSLKQNLYRLRNVLQKFGVTGRELGITAHGLRHQYAADRYEAFAGAAAPVRGGVAPDAETDDRARLQVAEELGHSRIEVVAAYLGQSAVMRSKVRKAAHAEDEQRDADNPDSGEGEVDVD